MVYLKVSDGRGVVAMLDTENFEISPEEAYALLQVDDLSIKFLKEEAFSDYDNYPFRMGEYFWSIAASGRW